MKLATYQDGTKPGRGCNHATWSLVYLWAVVQWVSQWLDIQGFTNFAPAHFVVKYHTIILTKILYLPYVLETALSVKRSMTIGEDRNKDRFKN